jgi:hypothetical protein
MSAAQGTCNFFAPAPKHPTEPWEQAIERSRRGHTSKSCCLANDRGRPVAFALTPGNCADITTSLPPLSAMTKPKGLIGNKAWDVEILRRWLKEHLIQVIILS